MWKACRHGHALCTKTWGSTDSTVQRHPAISQSQQLLVLSRRILLQSHLVFPCQLLLWPGSRSINEAE